MSMQQMVPREGARRASQSVTLKASLLMNMAFWARLALPGTWLASSAPVYAPLIPVVQTAGGHRSGLNWSFTVC